MDIIFFKKYFIQQLKINTKLQILRNNFFTEIQYDIALKLITFFWKKETYLIARSDVRLELHSFNRLLETIDGENLLIVIKNEFCTISPEMQTWINQNVTSLFEKLAIRKIAIIPPTDYIADLSVKQTINEAKEILKNKITIRVFDTEQTARRWLRP